MDTSVDQRPAHRYTDLMPALTDQEYQVLKNDIRHKGVLVPIEYDEEGNIIDGRHRFKAFVELVQEGADVPMHDKMVRRFESEDAKIDYILSLNVKRRHLTAQQRADLVITLRRRGYTMQRIADLLNVTKKTVSVDISLLPTELRDELMSIERVSSDGRVFTSNYAPHSFQTGHQILREVQERAVQQIAQQLAANPPIQVTGGADNSYALPPRVTNEPQLSDTESKQRIIKAFGWYGGKGIHLDWLLPLLPKCQHFVDVFGGSGVVLFNREPSPIETYNDIDNYVVTFFRVLRDNPEELVRQVYLTVYSREERRIAYRGRQKAEELTDLEKARRFFVLARQSHRAQAQDCSGHYLNAWRASRNRITRGKAFSVADWELAMDGLAYVAARLKSVQIENYPWERVVENYDAATTLFYCDPPYVHSTRGKDHTDRYVGEMTDEDHTRLAVALHKIKGLAAVSGYRSKLYDDLYHDWHRFDMPTISYASQYTSERFESLWCNYNLGVAK